MTTRLQTETSFSLCFAAETSWEGFKGKEMGALLPGLKWVVVVPDGEPTRVTLVHVVNMIHSKSIPLTIGTDYFVGNIFTMRVTSQIYLEIICEQEWGLNDIHVACQTCGVWYFTQDELLLILYLLQWVALIAHV